MIQPDAHPTPGTGRTHPYRVADLVVDALSAHGVDRIFSVPGESFLALLDALHERRDIDLVTARHEGGAALSAIADAKLTGRPGVVLVSRGPGAFNAALGLHVAEQEAIPLIVFVGQVDLPNLGRGAVQEINTGSTFRDVIKWSTRIVDPSRAAEQIARAFAAASGGTPGPVMVELPEDVLAGPATASNPAVHGRAVPEPGQDAVRHALEEIAAASRPILLVGGECRTPRFRDDLVQLSEHLGLPVAVTNKNQDQFPNAHPHFAGQIGFFASPAHVDLFGRTDLILAIGTRLGDLATMGFAYPRQHPDPQTLIHVYPDANAIGRLFKTKVPVVASAHGFIDALLSASPRQGNPAWLDETRAAYLAAHGWRPDLLPKDDVLGHAVTALAAAIEPDAIVTTDSGNFAAWVHRAFSFTPSNRLLGSACGAMGSGVPSGLAAALRHPGRRVIAFCGDGGFLMTGSELAIAAERQLDLTVVVSNNGSYGTIRSHQERHFPGRVSGTNLYNPDFVALGRAFGMEAFRISTSAEARMQVDVALARRGPVLIEVCSSTSCPLERSVRSMLS